MLPIFNAVKDYLSEVPDAVDANKLRYYYSELIACVFSFLVHFILLIVFLSLQITPLYIYNIFSLSIFATAFVFVKKGNFKLSYYLMGFEFTTHQALCVILIGWDSGMQFWLITMCVGVLLVSENKKIGTPISIMLAIEYIVLDVYFRNATPFYFISPGHLSLMYYATLISAFCSVLLILFYYEFLVHKFEKELEVEHQKSDKLLHNILPAPIAKRLKECNKNLTDGFTETSILFADIVGFTHMSQKSSPDEIVGFLNDVFSSFDDLTEKYNLEKIKTIGDAYMVVSGIPVYTKEHAELIAQMALDMSAVACTISDLQGTPLKIRIGINSGPVTAGVIGKKKFIYDLWGDSVNLASRMESHGIAGEIQVTQSTYELLKDKYQFCARGEIDVKSKGKLTTYLLKGKIGH